MKAIFCGLFLIVCGVVGVVERKVVCYHGTWSTYRHSNGKFDVEDINPNLCTHLMYAFFGIKESGEFRIIDPYLDLEENWGRGNVKKFNDLKTVNPELKTLAAVGGWNEGSKKFSQVAKDPSKRKLFITTAKKFVLDHGFDGIDLDWEYPAQRDGDPELDKDNFIVFLRELKEELSKSNLLLTAAVASAEFSANLSYHIPEVVKYLDFVNVMAYDLHGSWENRTGINAPLYAGPADITTGQKQLNVNASLSYWLSKGAPPEKIVLGLPLYGRTFSLSNVSRTEVGALNTGPGLAGQYSNEPGMIGYNEFCERLLHENWTIKWEKDQKVPYAHKDRYWVGYEDIQSIRLKSRFAKEHNLGGVMVWSVETDDFRGLCGQKYPLLKTINAEYRGIYVQDPKPTTAKPSTTSTTTSTTTTTTTTTRRPTTLSPTSTSTSLPLTPTLTPLPTPGTSADAECERMGNSLFGDEEDCRIFYLCDSGKKYTFRCPPGLAFDPKISNCNFEYLVSNCK